MSSSDDGQVSDVEERLGEALTDAIRGPGKIAVEGRGGRRAEADVIDADRLGVEVERVRVQGPSSAAIEARAIAIAAHLRPGGERLVPVEIDDQLGGGVLRTHRQEVRAGRFYQVDLDVDGAELGRFRVNDDGERIPEPFTVTREQLGQIVDALSPKADDAGEP